MASVNPYLVFNGNCEEAFKFYQSVLGGEIPYIGRFSEMDCGVPVPEEESQKIMHIALPVGNGSILMGSDTLKSQGEIAAGSNFSISLDVDSKEEADRVYAGLSADGKATMPMQNAFWGSYFGMLTDKFGINWMVSYDEKPCLEEGSKEA